LLTTKKLFLEIADEIKQGTSAIAQYSYSIVASLQNFPNEVGQLETALSLSKEAASEGSDFDWWILSGYVDVLADFGCMPLQSFITIMRHIETLLVVFSVR
jgi:hypothetical protein